MSSNGRSAAVERRRGRERLEQCAELCGPLGSVARDGRAREHLAGCPYAGCHEALTYDRCDTCGYVPL